MTTSLTTYSWMLDTNMVGALSSAQYPGAERRVAILEADEICVSVISEGEILFGLAKNPATRAAATMRQALTRFTIAPWRSSTAAVYGKLRATLHHAGRELGALDMLIAAHALEVGATLVTADRAFLRVPDLKIENWLE